MLHALCILQSERLNKVLIFFLMVDFFCIYVCLSLWAVWMFVCFCMCCLSYIYVSHIVAWIFTIKHIFPLSVVGEWLGKGRQCEKWSMGEGSLWKNCYNQTDSFSLDLTDLSHSSRIIWCEYEMSVSMGFFQ